MKIQKEDEILLEEMTDRNKKNIRKDEMEFDKKFKLEEGGFFIISNENNRLVLEYKFHSFKKFTKNFFPR